MTTGTKSRVLVPVCVVQRIVFALPLAQPVMDSLHDRLGHTAMPNLTKGAAGAKSLAKIQRNCVILLDSANLHQPHKWHCKCVS